MGLSKLSTGSSTRRTDFVQQELLCADGRPVPTKMPPQRTSEHLIGPGDHPHWLRLFESLSWLGSSLP